MSGKATRSKSSAAAPKAQQNNIGVLGGDTAGFPNGRRPGDDVVDMALRVVMGVLLPAAQAPSGQLAYAFRCASPDISPENAPEAETYRSHPPRIVIRLASGHRGLRQPAAAVVAAVQGAAALYPT